MADEPPRQVVRGKQRGREKQREREIERIRNRIILIQRSLRSKSNFENEVVEIDGLFFGEQVVL